MPELSPKKSDAVAGFGRLSRSIGDGSLRFHSSKRAKPTGGSRGSSPEPASGYAELQATSNFSFLRGASHPDELVVTAAALGHGAIAITDRNSVAGLVRAHHAAQTVGIRLVIGVRLDLADGTSLLAFPEDRAAYGRLMRLLTLGKRRAPKGECHLDYADLVAHGEGQILIVLPPAEGDVAEFAAHLSFARQVAADFRGRAYLAAHHLYRGDDAGRLARLADIAADTGLPLVATNDVHYHEPERRPLQDVLTCIREHCTIAEAGFRLAAHAERHLKPAAEMARLFRGHEDALARSLEIARRCRFSLDELRYEYPEEPVPDGMTPQQRLAQLAWQGAAERFAINPSPPFRAEREGPIAQRWEGEVGIGKRSGIPHLTPTLSAPGGGEGENRAGGSRQSQNGSFMPPGSARPPVSLCISDSAWALTFARASLKAATIRSSSTSVSAGSTTPLSILSRFMSPLPFSVNWTMPPPATPVISTVSSSACISAIFCCICWACFISWPRFFMIHPLPCWLLRSDRSRHHPPNPPRPPSLPPPARPRPPAPA